MTSERSHRVNCTRNVLREALDFYVPELFETIIG